MQFIRNLNKRRHYTNLSSENKRCWACHGNSSEPLNGHPSNYKTPYRCENCHIKHSLSPFTPIYTTCSVCHYGDLSLKILPVTQHYVNGTSIKTSAAGTCYLCHTTNEMVIPAFDPTMEPVRSMGELMAETVAPSHYGKKRTDLSSIQDTNGYCTTCHSNASTVFPS